MATQRAKKIALSVVAALALLIVGTVLFAALFDWNRARDFISRRVSEEIGREVAILGDLDVDLSLTPRIRAENVVIRNPEWASRPNLTHIEAVEFQIRLLPLIGGRISIPEIELRGPDVMLERDRTGRVNWRFPGIEPDPEAPPPRIGRFDIDNGVLRLRDALTDSNVRIDVATRDPPPGEAQRPLVFSGQGRVQGEAFSAQGRAGSVLALEEGDAPYPLSLSVRAGESRATVRGTIADPLALQGVDLQIELAGPDLGWLQPLVGIEIPRTPAYALDGRLRRENGLWRLTDFDARLGESVLAGNFSIELGRERPYLRGDLRSRLLDLEDLSGIIGGRPGRGLLETAEERGRVLPERPLELGALRLVDADIRLKAERIETPPLPVEDLALHARLENGILRLDPLNFGFADGNIAGAVTVNARDRPFRVVTDLTLRRLDLRKLLPEMEPIDPGNAQVGGRIDVAGTGNSLAELAGSADGNVGVAMARAEISQLLVNALGLDIVGVIASLIGDEEMIPLHCAVADFDVQDGRMKVESFVVDTEESNLYVRGSIALGREAFDLTLFARPKDPTLSIRAPVQLGGTFMDPDVAVEPEAIAKGAGALALGAIAPPAALLPLIDPGPAEDNPCRELMEQAETKDPNQDESVE